MPHYSPLPRFLDDLRALTPEARERFLRTVREAFVPDLETGSFRPGLRVKRVRGTRGIFEMTFAPDGRATWEYAPPREPGVPHVRWRRIGGHEIFGDP